MEKLSHLNSLVSKRIKNLKYLFKLFPSLLIHNTPSENLFNVVVIVVFVCTVVQQKKVHKLLFC